MRRLKVWWRRWVTARYLAPLNRQLAAEVPAGATVFDLGCAEGDLLLALAPRIDSGLGVDLSDALITEAAARADRAGHHNLTFADGEVSEMLRMLPVQPALTLVSLLLHELPRQDAQLLLQRLGRISDRLLIADLLEPPSLLQRLLLGLGEVQSDYFHHGGVPALLQMAGIPIEKEIETGLPGVHIWVAGKGE
jgi:ubiquinone/menaquinone biosynthesis C-methylase UbiE